jgi:hypothetical protein
MLREALKRKPVLALYERSHFKTAQLDSLMVKRYSVEHHLLTREALALRDKPTSLGSMERSVSQAERVISKSVATLTLGFCLGLISPNTIESAARLAAILQDSSDAELSEEQSKEFIALVDAILRQVSHK